MKTVFKIGKADSIIDGVVAELRNCSFIVYCADDKNFEEISGRLHKGLPEAKMIGTTGFMFSDQGSFSDGISAVGFTDSEAEVYVGTLRKVDTCPIRYLPGLIWSVETINQKYKNHLCIEFATGYEEKLVSTMKISLEKVGMRLLGGTAGNTQDGQPKKVACNGKVLTNAAVYAVIGSKMGKIEVFKENLFRPRKETHMVTRVSDDCRTIYEIDGRKAIDLYMDELGYTEATLEQGVFKSPLSRVVGSENYITAIFSFNQDRSITTYKNIQKNDIICFTNIEEDYKQFIKDNLNELTAQRSVAGILSINCILRYLFFENNAYTKDYANMFSNAAMGCHWGMVSDGEQYIEQHVNQSMVCAVFTRDN